jgi:hypothetical protein
MRDGGEIALVVDLLVGPAKRSSSCLADDVIDFGRERRSVGSLTVRTLAEVAVTLQNDLAFAVPLGAVASRLA